MVLCNYNFHFEVNEALPVKITRQFQVVTILYKFENELNMNSKPYLLKKNVIKTIYNFLNIHQRHQNNT